ncbi:MAG: succinate dehydrogenase/fumarate reductase iron-sulfur subunit [Ignavibacteriales bacterium]|nr:succinate dehydrogenase/fumarate reductase iron-sulfur subunit [Ignavibacteriales bacterium]
MNFTLKIWRQQNRTSKGKFIEYQAINISPDMSFLEMLDAVNRDLTKKSEDNIAFDHDCREGICGSCGLFINGRAHGPQRGVTTCELRMRHFVDGTTITVEPWRSRAFPVIKDLVVDRTAFERIIQAGGYVSVDTGSAPEASSIPVPKANADEAMDAAACIGCGACAAACKNSSPMLFLSAKVSQFALLPQGNAERRIRVQQMVKQMDEDGFGLCSNTYACEVECPKKISVVHIARMNREFLRAKFL